MRYDKTGEKYPTTMILRVAGCSSCNWHETSIKPTRERCRKPKLDDAEALSAIEEAIKKSPFTSEGNAKIWARMRRNGTTVSRAQVLRLMREHNLLSPYRHGKATTKACKHDGTIIQDRPNALWGTDGKKFFVKELGWCWFFGVIDHFNAELLSWHTCKKTQGTKRWSQPGRLSGNGLATWTKTYARALA